MIQNQTIIKVSDNSGAKTAKCIKIYEGFKKKSANIGDLILVSVQTIKNSKKIQKKQLFKALVIRQKVFAKQTNGFYFKFKDNAIVLIDKTKTPTATRVLGFLPKKLKNKFNKIASIANYLL